MTIDWLVLLGALTVTGLVVLDVGTGSMTDHSSGVEDELQSTEFVSEWDDYIPVQPEESDDEDETEFTSWIPGGDGSGTGSGTGTGTVTDPTTGNGNGNNGHGNDADGCDASNPGNNPNCVGDTTDDDGTPGNGNGNGSVADPDPDPTPYDPGTFVSGCPSTQYLGTEFTLTGDELEDDKIKIDVAGGGDTQLASCGLSVSGYPTGYTFANPVITLNLSDMDDFKRLQVELDSDCDTTLLIRDADGNYYFDDDSGSGLDSKLRLTDMSVLNGQIDIFVGTYGGDTCDEVEVEIQLKD